MKTVAIIGGGITGLTAAFRLRQQNIPVTVYEAAPRTGGVIQTFRKDGWLAEHGPNTILETSPLIGALIRDLGLESRRLYSDPAADRRYVVRGQRPVALPGSPLQFLGTPLFSTAAKLRLACEPFIRRADPTHEESVADFVRRRIGPEFLDYAINPFVAGVYAGDPERLSVQQAFPKLAAVEQEYGSLIVGQYLGARKRKRRGEISKQTAKKLSFDHGLQVLTDTLREQLGEAVRLESRVTEIEEIPSGWRVVSQRHGEEMQEHSAVLLTAPTHCLAGIQCRSHASQGLSFLREVKYPPVASVVLGFRREDIAHPLDGFGMLVPQVEGFDILGTIFSSALFPGRAPAGHVTLTSYLGGTRAPDLALSHARLLTEVTLKDLGKLLGVRGQPVFQHHCCFRQAIPQYELGYGAIRQEMTLFEKDAPGIFFAGHFRDGVSLGDSIVAGQAAAERLGAYLPRGLQLHPAKQLHAV